MHATDTLITRRDLAPSQPATGISTVDFDLHGIVGIRLHDASASDCRAVSRQLGPVRQRLERPPDIEIQFVDHLPLPSSLRYLGVEDAGYTDDAFFIFRSRRKAPCRVQIPMDQIGGACRIICQSGLPAVPLLIPIINLTALAKGYVALHASAFRYRGTGVLVAGWAKGGKTETLLAFAAQGAEYIGDEWIYLHPQGERMYGIPQPVTVWDWHLREMAPLKRAVSRKDRCRLAALQAAITTSDLARKAQARMGLGRHGLLHRLIPLLRRQAFVHLPPQRAFGQGTAPLSARPEMLLFVASHASDQTVVQAIDVDQVADRMVFSLQEERQDLLSYYHKFRFAFPARENPWIEQAESLQRQSLRQALAGLRAYAVYHPYPVAIPSLFAATRHLFTA